MRHLKIVAVFATIAMLFGCQAPAPTQIADSAATKSALSFQVPANSARVYFVNGKNLNAMWDTQHKFPANVYVNGQEIGSFNSSDVFVMNLKPGTYDISWRPRSTDPIDGNAAMLPYKAELKKGDLVVLAGDYKVDFGGGLGFGLIGGVIATANSKSLATTVVANKQNVMNKTVVVPQSCPPTICVSQ